MTSFTYPRFKRFQHAPKEIPLWDRVHRDTEDTERSKKDLSLCSLWLRDLCVERGFTNA
jgi:hypothetical protein